MHFMHLKRMNHSIGKGNQRHQRIKIEDNGINALLYTLIKFHYAKFFTNALNEKD